MIHWWQPCFHLLPYIHKLSISRNTDTMTERVSQDHCDSNIFIAFRVAKVTKLIAMSISSVVFCFS